MFSNPNVKLIVNRNFGILTVKKKKREHNLLVRSLYNNRYYMYRNYRSRRLQNQTVIILLKVLLYIDRGTCFREIVNI